MQPIFNQYTDMDDTNKKRTREEIEEDKKNRGNYRCGRCNLPKKGHVCPYQPKFRKRELPLEGVSEMGVQVEMDDDMTIRCLDLTIQGLPSSYIPISEERLTTYACGTVSRDTCYSESLISDLLRSENSQSPQVMAQPSSAVEQSALGDDSEDAQAATDMSATLIR